MFDCTLTHILLVKTTYRKHVVVAVDGKTNHSRGGFAQLFFFLEPGIPILIVQMLETQVLLFLSFLGESFIVLGHGLQDYRFELEKLLTLAGVGIHKELLGVLRLTVRVDVSHRFLEFSKLFLLDRALAVVNDHDRVGPVGLQVIKHLLTKEPSAQLS
jgi:hypothetical protein